MPKASQRANLTGVAEFGFNSGFTAPAIKLSYTSGRITAPHLPPIFLSLVLNGLVTSYFGIILFLVLTGCGLPIPEEFAIIAAGIGAGAGNLDLWWAFAACMLGALLGDSVMYAIGRFFGRGLMRGKWFSKIVNAEAEARTERLIRKHGLKVFFVARFLVGVRAPMYVAAGIMRLSFARFLIIDSICATIVVGIVYWLSYFMGNRFRQFFEGAVHDSQVWLTIIALSAALVGGIIFWLHRRKHRKHKLSDLETTLGEESLSQYGDEDKEEEEVKSNREQEVATQATEE
ncbi:MAG: DedA family protein [Pirellulales bacterium]|nr:DedA family protein [Pirellulales bacterium]